MITPDKQSVRQGLVQIVGAERFQSKPLSGSSTHVVVMEKTGSALRHYCTLKSPNDKLSIGEQFWGNYVCYVVDLSSRELHIQQEFQTQDRITKIKINADVTYHVVDGERVTIGVEDALASLQEDLSTALRREVAHFALEQITEEQLEERLRRESSRMQGRLGIVIEKARVRVDWPEEILARRRAAIEEMRAQKAEEKKRQRDWELEDRKRKRELELEEEKRSRDLELEEEKRKRDWEIEEKARERQDQMEFREMDHVDEVIRRLGLEGLPADLRLRFRALPRQEAYSQIIKVIEEQRAHARDVMGYRMKEEYEILKQMIAKGDLEDMDLVEFGKTLLERYSHSLAAEESFGMPPSLLFGDSPRAKLVEGKSEQKESPEKGPSDQSPKDDSEAASSAAADTRHGEDKA